MLRLYLKLTLVCVFGAPLLAVNLQQPKISFSTADERDHYGPGGPEVITGYSFSIICSTEPQYPGGSFHLKFSGSNLTRTQSAVNHSAVFQFPPADFVHQGNYSCTYEVTVSSRTFTVTTPEPLLITVKASLVPYIVVGVTAGLLFILVPAIVCFVRMKKKRKSQDAQCELSNPDENQSDDEADYVNANIFIQQTDDSDESEHDYVDVDVEQSHADNDYENVSVNSNMESR